MAEAVYVRITCAILGLLLIGVIIKCWRCPVAGACPGESLSAENIAWTAEKSWIPLIRRIEQAGPDYPLPEIRPP